MLMVEADPVLVEGSLVGGRFCCPGCGGWLVPWGFARRRPVRVEGARLVWLRPRRTRCGDCGVAHVLLSVGCLARRRDSGSVIVAALVAHVGGEGFRPIAGRLGVPGSTVRGWFRRFRVNAWGLMVLFRSWALRLDPGLDPPLPTGTVAGDALECLGLAARAVVMRFGPRPVSAMVARLTGGGLLSNTSSLWLRPG